MAKILVADDEEGVRSFIAEALEREGHSVLTARDGLEASKLLEQQGVDLLVTDLKMPRLGDGAALEGPRGAARRRGDCADRVWDD